MKKIYDNDNQLIENPDLNKGYLIEDQIFIKHHEAIKEIPEQWHYQITKIYPNGGKDIQRIIDIPKVIGKEAWDEYEDIYRYIEFTPAELEEKQKQQNQPSVEERLAAIESLLLDMVMKGNVL